MSSTTTQSSSVLPSSTSGTMMRDIFFWKKKKQSSLVLLISTATWVLLQFYQFNFVTVLSWVAMVIVVSLFLWGNLLRLFGKETTELLSGEEITVESALKVAMALRTWTEESIRWMFKVGAQSDLLTFASTLFGLWLLSQVGNYFDFLTIQYIGIVMGMTLPVIYSKYEDNIKRLSEGVKKQLHRYYDMFDEKVIKKVTSMMGTTTTSSTTTPTPTPTPTPTLEKEKKVD
ncbi:reticulon-like protein B13 [Cannabis sativa]|uniref:reticulon-like protein B13 n=1 Tax=Cannabis sativa TaxID=3483 RepID=UPI0029CA9CCE|nr:reticulon-like protein B13 [Cannabis sativa]